MEVFFGGVTLGYLRSKNHPKKGVICTQNFYSTFRVKVTPKRAKTTQVRSNNNAIFVVILTPDWKLKELLSRKWLNNVNLSRFSTQNLFQIRACVISARKAKHLDVTTMFAYSHANTSLGQSERAYYLSYFVNNCRPIGIVYIVLRRIHYLADVT